MAINISIVGVSGKVGKCVLECALKDSAFSITGGSVGPMSPYHNCDLGEILDRAPFGIEATSDLEKALRGADIAIDFSTSFLTPQLIETAIALKVPLVIGTTGHGDEFYHLLDRAGTAIPIFYASNFSIGIALLREMIAVATKQLGSDCSTDIIETHRLQKKDLPSGTAISLAEELSKEPSFHSIRAGNRVGEHEVLFHWGEEQLSLKHTCYDRKAYAIGALKAASYLFDQPPGIYTMEDLLTCGETV